MNISSDDKLLATTSFHFDNEVINISLRYCIVLLTLYFSDYFMESRDTENLKVLYSLHS